MKKILIIVAILSLTACEKGYLGYTGVLLTTARGIRGTWKSAAPIKMTYQTDFCDFVNINDIATTDWDVTWEIKQNNSDDHKVNITMTFYASNYQSLGGCGGYIPAVSPMILEATINGAYITIDQSEYGSTYKFDGSFTSESITGTWKSSYYGVYYTGEISGTNAFILYKK